jgi:hypothetical protein
MKYILFIFLFISFNLFSQCTCVTISGCETGNCGNFSWISTCIGLIFNPPNAMTQCNTFLPIELKYFDIIKTYEGNLIVWITASETNNDYFLLERSYDGENWVGLDKINGAGSSNLNIRYNYIDKDFGNFINYYRLTQVDFDGNFEVFNIISIDNRFERKIVKIIDITGRIVNEEYNGLVIIQYSDNTFEKKYNKKVD